MPISERDFMQQPAAGPGALDALRWLMGINIAVFVAQYGFGLAADQIEGVAFQPWGGLTLEGLKQGHLWLLISHAFVHGSLGHVIFNLLMLHFGGGRLQQVAGPQALLKVYALGAICGGLLQVGLHGVIGEDGYIIGASGGVMAILLALAVLAPAEQVELLVFLIIPVRFTMRGLGRFLILSSLFMGLLGLLEDSFSLPLIGGGRVAEFAHLGGCLAGWWWARQWSPLADRGRRRSIDGGLAPVGKSSAGALEPQSSLRLEVDRILEQINERGIDSLSPEQRRTLDLASQLWRDR